MRSEIESSFSMSNTYQVLSQSDTVVEGTDLETFEPYADQLEEGSFDWWELAGNIIAGLVVAVAVAAVVAASILFLPVVIAVVMGAAVATSTIVAASVIGGATFGVGTVATLATAGKDIQNQEIRDRSVYVDNAYKAAATVGAVGQMVYGAYGLATFAASLPTLLKNLSNVLSQFINGTGGYGGLALSTISGGSTVVGGGVSIEGLLALGLSFERALELLAQGGWNAATGYAMFADADGATSSESNAFNISDRSKESWGNGTMDSVEDSLNYHFKEHGAEVGASDIDQYVRKAEGFMQNLRGAHKAYPSGGTLGAVRYAKNGKYIIIGPDGKILSFGLVR